MKSWAFVVLLVGCNSEPPATSETLAAVSAPPAISGFVLYADKSIRLGAHTAVESGDVGIALPASPDAGAQLSAGEHLIAPHSSLYAQSVTLAEHGNVDVVGASSMSISGSIIRATTAYPASSMPRLPLVARPTPGTIDVVVDATSRRVVTAGDYRELRVDGTVILEAGVYSFSNVTLGPCSRLLADHGGVQVRIAGTLTAADAPSCAVKITPVRNDRCGMNGTCDEAASGLEIDVAGEDVGGAFAVSLGRMTVLRALVSAPHGTIAIADGSHAAGAFGAFAITVGDNATIDLDGGFPSSPPGQTGSQQLIGYLGIQPDGSYPVMSPVPGDTVVSLSIGLPVRDPQALDAFIHDVSDPHSPTYRQYLTIDQFRQTYGATDADYQAVIAWANSVGLTVNITYANNLLVTVTGTAGTIEQAFHVNLVYRQASRAPAYFLAVDREPSVDLAPRLLHVSGFTDAASPIGGDCAEQEPASWPLSSPIQLATGPQGFLMAADLRNAYLGIGSSCQSLDGTGQVVGILALQPFDPADIDMYAAAQTPPLLSSSDLLPSGHKHVSLVNVSGTSIFANVPEETTLDVESVMALAPRAEVKVFQGSFNGLATVTVGGGNLIGASHVDDLMHAMATDPDITVGTSSWWVGRSDNSAQALSEMAAQGVTFFTLSNDYGNIGDPEGSLHMGHQTIVGGTVLGTNGLTGGVYNNPYFAGETTWNQGCPGFPGVLEGGIFGASFDDQDITGGGIMNGQGPQCFCFPQPYCCDDVVDIPDYQNPDLMNPINDFGTGNGGSKQYRNFPDVAATAFGVEIAYQGEFGMYSGTSISTPLWAGFTALINQDARLNHVGQLGFANPVLYAIGDTRGTHFGDPAADLYTQCFNDVSDGAFNAVPAGLGYPAVPGYDLATGWGSPTCGLIQQLGTYDPTAPQTFSRVLVHVATGHDGVDDDSEVTLTLRTRDNLSSSRFVLKGHGQPGWDAIGNEHDFSFAVGPTRPYDIGGVTLHLDGDNDDWDVTGVQVMLAGPPAPGPPYGCITDVSGRNGCDVEQPGCGIDGRLGDGSFGVTRLNQSHPDALFDTYQLQIDPLARTFGGCTAWGGSVDVTSFDKLYFVVDTGDDDLNDDSTVQFDVLAQDGTVLDTGFIHRPSLPWNDQSQWNVLVDLGTRLAYTDIDSVRLTLHHGTNNSEDEWHIEAINVYGVDSTKDWEYTCLFHGEEQAHNGCGHPLQDLPCYELKLDTDDGPTMQLLKTAICQ